MEEKSESERSFLFRGDEIYKRAWCIRVYRYCLGIHALFIQMLPYSFVSRRLQNMLIQWKYNYSSLET